jgi:hypothetical protein
MMVILRTSSCSRTFVYEKGGPALILCSRAQAAAVKSCTFGEPRSAGLENPCFLKTLVKCIFNATSTAVRTFRQLYALACCANSGWCFEDVRIPNAVITFWNFTAEAPLPRRDREPRQTSFSHLFKSTPPYPNWVSEEDSDFAPTPHPHQKSNPRTKNRKPMNPPQKGKQGVKGGEEEGR